MSNIMGKIDDITQNTSFEIQFGWEKDNYAVLDAVVDVDNQGNFDFDFYGFEPTYFKLINSSGDDLDIREMKIYYTCEESYVASLDDLTFTLNGSYYSVGVNLNHRDTVEQIVIPSTYNDKPVNAISNSGFKSCKSLERVYIPNSITSFGGGSIADKNPFALCPCLETVQVSENTIPPASGHYYYSDDYGVLFGDYYQAGVKDDSKTELVFVPSTLDLDDYVIPNETYEILDYAFSFTNISTITINENVDNIVDNAFAYSESLEEIVVVEGNKTYNSVDGVLLTENSTELICCPTLWGLTTNTSTYAVPDTVTILGNEAFCGCSELDTVTFSNDTNLNTIDDFCFAYSSITSLIIPKTVETIYKGITIYCNNLESLSVAGENEIYTSSFDGNDLNAIYKISDHCIIAGSQVSTIDGLGGFSIYDYAFTGIDFQTNTINATSIGDSAFYDCEFLGETGGKPGSLNMPFISTIGENCFTNCASIAQITLNTSMGNGLSLIKDGAFENCTNLAKFNFGSNVSDNFIKISNQVFKNCNNLQYSNGTNPFEVPSTIQTIGKEAFMNCSSLKELDFSLVNNLATIGEASFYGCTSIKNFGSGFSHLTDKIGDYAFYNCSSLQYFEIDESDISTIGNHAFENCTSLVKLSIPDSIENIGTYALANCTNLAYVGETPTEENCHLVFYCSYGDLSNVTFGEHWKDNIKSDSWVYFVGDEGAHYLSEFGN